EGEERPFKKNNRPTAGRRGRRNTLTRAISGDITMQNLEQKIAAWRARLSAALPGQEETVRELEEHLRDNIDGQIRGGRSADDAFAQGVARLGAPRALAREFGRVETGWLGIWRPALVIYAVAAVVFVLMVGLAISYYSDERMGLFPLFFCLTLAIGYLVTVAAGMVGLCVLVSGWRRPLGERELAAQRRELRRLAMVAGVFVPLALLLMFGQASLMSSYRLWSGTPVEIGVVAVAVAMGLLWLVQWRGLAHERTRVIVSVLGATAVGASWLAFGALAREVPVAWLCLAATAGHGAVALLHVRSKRGVADEGPRLASG
ncbi:MAG: hypothetical protein NTV51_17050, partial [Verrucomicrobia bacterium]|nr:hypothetical protein [Verrucomicrobiota bacterium]